MDIDKLQENISTLNEPQRAAVECAGGPMLVIAGAGSGKTRVLTMRIANLLTRGVKPYNILALTFTNKAANEMKERIARIVGHDVAMQLWMGTFHSVFSRILRMEHAALGLSSNFTIYDSADSKSLIANIVKQMGLDSKNNYKKEAIASAISSAKNDMILPADYLADTGRMEADKYAKRPLTAEIYKRYMEECAKANALDFDDLLLYTNLLFQRFPDILAKYQDKFRHIMVDEYQDTNRVQYIIINRLAQAHHNICVVGDDAQSIYSFRGARIENILNFRNDYPETQTFKLEQNYRSTQNIVGAANKLIAHNEQQIPKNVFSEGDEGDLVRIWPCASDRTEASKVVGDIVARKRLERKHFSDFAILYRNNSQSRALEEELRTMGVPYKIYGGLAFYQRKEIKDTLAYLRLIVNNTDIEALRRIINYPKRQIGDTTVEKMMKHAVTHDLRLWDVMSTPRELAQTGLNGPTQSRILNFVALMDTLRMQSFNLDAYQITVEMMSQTGLLQELNANKEDVEGKERFANVQELLNSIKDFCDNMQEQGETPTLGTYLQDVALVTDQDTDDDTDKVTMMTIHSSKGLEFDTVYIVGVEEGLFPSSMSAYDGRAVQEERRLMYVALTRAERNVNVSFAGSRYVYGKQETTRPSRFISELDPTYCDTSLIAKKSESPSSFSFGNGMAQRNTATRQYRDGLFGRTPQSPAMGRSSAPTPRPIDRTQFRRVEKPKSDFAPNRATSSNATPDGQYTVGMRIAHDRFGKGVIKEIIGTRQEDIRLRIEFASQGEKTLLLKFARIRPA